MFDSLIQETRAFLAEAELRGAEGAGHLGAVIAALDGTGPAAQPVPRLLPTVARHLETAAAQAPPGPAARLAAAIESAAPLLAWHDSSQDYPGEPAMAAFTRGFAYTSLIGPARYGLDSPLASEAVFLGFSLQAPGILYPAHGHRAREIYGVISGAASWWRAGEGWRPRPPGSFILHEPDRAHAMETGGEPLLSLFAWVSDLDSALWVGAG